MLSPYVADGNCLHIRMLYKAADVPCAHLADTNVTDGDSVARRRRAVESQRGRWNDEGSSSTFQELTSAHMASSELPVYSLRRCAASDRSSAAVATFASAAISGSFRAARAIARDSGAGTR